MVVRSRSRAGAGIALDAAGVKFAIGIKAAEFKLEAAGFTSLKLPEKSTVSQHLTKRRSCLRIRTGARNMMDA